MRRSCVVLSAVVALLVAGAPAATAADVADVDVTSHAAPDPVSDVRAYDDEPAVTVDWANPGTRFDHVVVRYRRGPVAPKYRHGHFRGRHVHVASHAEYARLTHLAHNTAYSVTVWTVSRRGVRSRARHTHFTTDGAKVGRGTYTARFVDASGHPLAGVLAYASSFDSDHEVRATTGRDGTVSLTVPAGEYFVGGDGEDATGGASDATGYVGAGSIATIRPGQVLRGGSIVLHAGGLVHVHVSDMRGRPAVGVTASLAPVPEYVPADGDEGDSLFDVFDPLAQGRTDSNGDTTLRGVQGGTPFRVCVDPVSGPADSTGPDFLAGCTNTSQFARARRSVSNTALVLQRHTGGTVRGVVRAREHSGFRDSYVELLRGKALVASTTSAAGGRFRITGVPAGTYRVCAVDGMFPDAGRTGYLPGCGTRRVTVSGSSAASSAIVLRPAAAATGTVTGPHGTPVAGADVQFTRSSVDPAGTDAEGHFLVKGLSPGLHHVCVFTDNMMPSKALPFGVRGTCGNSTIRLHAVVGRISTGVDVHLKVAAAVSGTVLDSAGHPVPYAEVDAEVNTESEFGEVMATVAGPHGRFRLIGLARGSYQICAGISGDPLYTETVSGCHHGAVRARVGHLTAAVHVPVPVTSAVRVTVVDDGGRPVAGVDATVVAACRDDCFPGTPVFPKPTSVAASATTDGHGVVQLDELRPGHYAVCLFAYYGTTVAGGPTTGYADRCSADTFDVDVRPGHTTATHLVVHQGGVVSGRITDAAGAPLRGVLVHVQGSAADDLPVDDTEYSSPPGDPFDGDGGAAASPGYYSTTADDGTYSVRSVRPGDRLVCVDAHAAAGVRYVSQCVGGAVGSTKKGAPVTVTGGRTTSGVDLALTAAGSIEGTVTSHPKAHATVAVLFRGQHLVAQVHPNVSGKFAFRRVIPGTYSVCAVAYRKSSLSGRCYRDAAWDPNTDAVPPADATAVPVAAGAAISDIDITVAR